MRVTDLSVLSGLSRQQINRLVNRGAIPGVRRKENGRLEIDGEVAAAWASSMPSKRQRINKAMDELETEIYWTRNNSKFTAGQNIPSLALKHGVSKQALYQALARWDKENAPGVKAFVKRYLRYKVTKGSAA